jgi:hypothetical protein
LGFYVACGEPEQLPPAPIASATLATGVDTSTGDDCPAGGCGACELPHEACADEGDPLRAMGLACPDRMVDDATASVNAEAIAILDGIGTGTIYAPREGDTLVALGTGSIAGLTSMAFCNAFLGAEFDVSTLPEPIRVDGVDGDCQDDTTLVGTGDCSKTIAAQFNAGMFAHDYSEIRFTTVAPEGATAVKFDFAFLSSEYPDYYPSEFNDMFIAWLESERWTGNVSFDMQGNPISLNAGFLDYRDDDGALEQFAGTCIASHAGTRWLTSTAAIAPGEEITMLFAIFDMADAMYDSFVLLDNFRWGCDDDMGPPSTMPDDTTGTTG